jgi:para-aminobenzoate synthetase/4-amino-4-deoxychorismate lyase
MKGTIERGKTTAEDLLNEQKLLNNQKDRAENLMIVDLMRNDLGRVAHLGSVQVDRLFEIEKLPTLFQMTSSLQARLADSVSLEQLLQALFPSGSVTGTPKLAAMRLIHELEDSPRGVYCGALGHLTPGETRFNVPIRTIVLKQEGARSAENPDSSYLGELGVGSGIVADSEPVSEWSETGLKASFLVRSQPDFSLVETIRFEKSWVRLSAHLERLRDSADYFGFPFDAGRIEEALDNCGTRGEEGAFKVRLLLGDKGDLRTEISEVPPETTLPRLATAFEETNSDDVFLYHKTTHRPLYHQARKAAPELGLWDFIFQNSRGEVTEGSICNIFIQLDGRWFTPPQRCGLLKGIMRAEMLRELNASEETFRMEELYRADEILVTNSVQGALTAELVDRCYSVNGLSAKHRQQAWNASTRGVPVARSPEPRRGGAK